MECMRTAMAAVAERVEPGHVTWLATAVAAVLVLAGYNGGHVGFERALVLAVLLVALRV